MAKILGFMYMSVLFLFTLWYMVFCISEWTYRMKERKRMRLAREPEKPVKPLPSVDVVGKSTTVFLAPLTPEPILSEKLELDVKPVVETEPDIVPSEVEVLQNNTPALGEDELMDYPNENMDASADLSQGLTFEQISHAVEVLEGKKSGENNEYLAGETFSIMPDDFMNMICMQTDHESMIKRLIAGYLDFPDKMKPIPVLVANFDINNYV
jgi:hypothetical protein